MNKITQMRIVRMIGWGIVILNFMFMPPVVAWLSFAIVTAMSIVLALIRVYDLQDYMLANPDKPKVKCNLFVGWSSTTRMYKPDIIDCILQRWFQKIGLRYGIS